ncbi:formate dehydrogenase accessory sulfurtransferase FdhD [Solicola gregarius]|uniref:Sulfur carrier protein FdhD n=1 Tax=Solicola gregarius TaxID=2908642 RepID=A0AA46THU5_9ACTN|nr:formate dehydrogenase accessory sulfurtransferase FdhD [Solicola gregarius]UYM05134.1 formate dehydrogenase accessory sulfurtransferase FdhD [Solicola gregarius]
MARRPGPTRRVQVLEIAGSKTLRHEDRLATEEPLEMRVDAPGMPVERFGITMRTPGRDFELTAGLLFAEGVYAARDDVRSIAYCTDADLSEDEEFNVVTLHLNTTPATGWRARDVSSACGVCGKESVSDVAVAARPIRSDVRADPALIASLPDRLRAEQQVFATTGGLHAAGLFDTGGKALVVREDVGRHNAVDKAIGHCVLEQIDVAAAILCVSGRVAYEIVQKAAVAGIPLIAAVGAPSSLAVDVAKEVGIGVIGFVRDGRMVVYSHPERIAHADVSTR